MRQKYQIEIVSIISAALAIQIIEYVVLRLTIAMAFSTMSANRNPTVRRVIRTERVIITSR